MEANRKPHCFFCAAPLIPGKDPLCLSCPGCRASFRAKLDPSGCLLELKVENCGTPDCCQKKAKTV